ncbi:facilitated trehalose transporter Tret1 [Orussus abietinus]|uniref:facilitated trehalose transporter Tret1 n=1 Tax=Orussus abietinus TaxID=222816 RepID=UPI000626081E|nr:facilitated trehalose transporter Tret1 [Orussus abietinus]
MKILLRADTHINLEVPENSPKAKCTYSQVLAAFSVSLGSMVVGFSLGYTSPALVSMRDRSITSFEITEQTGSWVGGIMPLSALFGGIAGGPSIEYFGRRNTILATAFPFITAWLLIAMAQNIEMLLIGRALSGFCVGIASLSLPVYLGETVQPEVRGMLGLLPTTFGNIGILLVFSTGMVMNWSNLALLGACIPIPFLVLMFLIPETPRWYISKGKTNRARKALQWLRSKGSDVTEELTEIENAHIASERIVSENSFMSLFQGKNMKPLCISLGLMFFQQTSGINAVIFYTVTIFKDAGSTIDGYVGTILVGVMNFVATFIATALIDRLGRKILLYASSVAMIITLTTLGIFFYLKSSGHDVTHIGWLPLACLIVYALGFSLGMGPIPWLMMGEILPAKIRGSAASVATGFNWSCTFIVTKTFSDLNILLGSHGAFWIFALMVTLGLVFTVVFVPETSGRSLEEIEKKFAGPVRRTSAVANMKTMPSVS